METSVVSNGAYTDQTNVNSTGHREAAVPPRTRVAVLFGGRSVEHEISVITALEIISALDVVKYEPVPVYISITGKWFTGTELLNRDFYKRLPGSTREVAEVALMPIPGMGGMTVISAPQKSDLSVGDKVPVDVYFPAFHGQFGEDGCIQGLFEMASVPYVGCGVLASSVSMNKMFCKVVLKDRGIPVLPAVVVHKDELRAGIRKVCDRVLENPAMKKFPLFVKPCSLGSSIGVSRVMAPEDLGAALMKVFRFDLEAIVEPCVTQLVEINVSVRDGDEPVASVVEIPNSQSGVLTYEDKYLRGGGGKKGRPSQVQGMASLVRVVDPQELDPEVKKRVIDLAKLAFRTLGCRGLVRFDWMLDGADGQLYFNELNPFPGSLAYYLWDKSSPRRLYTENLSDMIAQSQRLFLEKEGLVKEMGFKALYR